MKVIPIFLLCLLFGLICQGQPYWQQKLHTEIHVTLDDQNHFLRGKLQISYTNQSPDTLFYIYMHLWPNAYKHDHTPFAIQQYQFGNTEFYYASADKRGFIDSLNFSIDDQDVSYISQESTPDIARIDLPYPLAPGKTMKIQTPFRVKIPYIFSRLGHNGQAYFISQWYPKPAVYDAIGWHPMSYLDIGEFYSEFSRYDVYITLPANYVVMATGNLQTSEEQTWMDELARQSQNNNQPATKPSKKKSTIPFPESSTQLKTLHFSEGLVHDFAWFADKRWSLRKDTIWLSNRQEPVISWIAGLPHDTKEISAQGVKSALTYYSEQVGTYPYQTIKTVIGDLNAGGGMEYPTLSLIDRYSNDIQVAIHEAGHNWFYGILASNERQFPWMDEGINSFYEQRAIQNKSTSNYLSKQKRPYSYNINFQKTFFGILQADGQGQASNLPSTQYRMDNYHADLYVKVPFLLSWLEAYMGADSFQQAMRTYFETWKFKHPHPEDFRKIMEQHTDKPINWFFDEAMTTSRPIDFALQKVQSQGDSLYVTIKNNYPAPLPVVLETYYQDTLLQTHVTNTFTGTIKFPMARPEKEWTHIKISELVPDINASQNLIQRHGLWKRTKPKLGLITGITQNHQYPIWFLPALGYNVYDGFSAGLVMHNLSIQPKRFRFILSPMWSFGSQGMHGMASAGYFWFPKNVFQEIELKTEYKHFSYLSTSINTPKKIFAGYHKVAPSLQFTLAEKDPHSKIVRSILLKGFYIQEESFRFQLDPTDSLYKPGKESKALQYGLIRYQHQNNRTFNPFSYQLEAHGGERFLKLQAEANLRIDYHIPEKSFYIRAYAGKLFLEGNHFSLNRYYLNSTYTGRNDYLYEETYTGRNEQEGIGARQISMREGGLKIPTPYYANPLGRSDNWLAAINLRTDLPLGKIPLQLYLDISTFADADKLNPSGQKILYSGGLNLHFAKMLYVYFPLVMSRDYQDYMKSIHGSKSFEKSITFNLELQHINWLKLHKLLRF